MTNVVDMSSDQMAYQEYLTGENSPSHQRVEQLKRAPTLWEYHAKQTDKKSPRIKSRTALNSRNSSSRISKVSSCLLKDAPHQT